MSAVHEDLREGGALVLGAGISGLACAHALNRRGVPVRVLELAQRAGGVLRTEVRAGFRFESGPNTVPASARAFRSLCDELGIAGRLVVSSDVSRTRYLFHRGRLVALPASPAALLASPLLSAGAKLRLCSEPLRRLRSRAGASGAEEASLEAFLEERIGREATRTLGGAFVRGVYAAEIDELGAESAFPRLVAEARAAGGLVRAMLRNKRAAASRETQDLPGPASGSRSDLLSFPDGFEELPRALATVLGEDLVLGAAAEGLERVGERWRVITPRGSFEAPRVILALPARACLRLLEPHLPAGATRPLAEVRQASITVVHLGLDAGLLPPGFGFLVPPDAALRGPAPLALGVLFPSNLFPGRAPEDASAVTCIYRTQDLAKVHDPLEQARADLALALGIERPLPRVSLTRVWNDVIPRYAVGHRARVEGLRGALAGSAPGLSLAGSTFDGVSVEDCIASGRGAAQAALDSAAEPAPIRTTNP